ncbi:hypothetical protein ABPG72_022128 [Tetrahymena utriculariae]
MLKRDNQNSQPKIKGPLIFDGNKWNNIPECIISFFNIINEKIVEIESNHVLLKTKQEQNFTKQNQVINECKTIAEETQLNFNLTNQTLNTNLKEVKNKCENQNTMMRIKMEEEIDKINKRIDDISRGVNMKIEDNNEILVLIKKEADFTKQMFKEAMEEQKNEERIINIVTKSPCISEFITNNPGIQDQLKQIKVQASKDAISALDSIFDNNNDKEESQKNGKSVGFLQQIENKTKENIKREVKLVQEVIEKQQTASNDLILDADKEINNLQKQIEQISQITRKYEKERNNVDFDKLKLKYDQLESQLVNFNENFTKIQENMDLISQTLSHKLNDKIKQRSVTPSQMVRQSGTQDSNFSSKLNDLPSFSSNKLSEQHNQQNDNKQIELQIPTQNSSVKEEMLQEDVTLEDRLQTLSQRLSLLELQFNQMKVEMKDENSDEDTTQKKSNQNEASKNNLHKPWLTGQEVILKEGDNLAIKVFQKSQQINRKSKQLQNMYQNPQVLAKKYRNSILGQEIDGLKINQNKDIGVRSNSNSKIQDPLHNPHNMTAYYKQNYAFDSSPEKSKKNSFSNANSQNEFQFTNDLIKSQLDNYSNRVKTQGENNHKNEFNLLENQKNYNSQGEIETKINPSNHSYLPPAPRSRNSKTFHSGANTAITSSNISYINQSADQTNGQNTNNNNSFLQSNITSMPQSNTNKFQMGQNISNFQPQKAPNQHESPLNSYKLAKNVMKSTKLKTFRISQGVSFDAINLSKF